MNKKHNIVALLILLTVIPAGVVLAYWQDALQYQNSPHISTLWNKNEPTLYLDNKTLVRQSFVPVESGLSKISIQVSTGEDEYKWSIKKSLTGEALYTSHFKGDEVQNYSFVQLLIPNEVSEQFEVDGKYWLELEKLKEEDSYQSVGHRDVGLFQTMNDYQDGELTVNETPIKSDLVLQLYYLNDNGN